MPISNNLSHTTFKNTISPISLNNANKVMRYEHATFASIFCALSYLFFLGALTHLFGAETGGGTNGLRAIYQPIALCLQLTAIALILKSGYRRQRAYSALIRSKSLIASIVIIICSSYWSIDSELTIRRSVALIGTTSIGLLIFIEYENKDLLGFFSKNLAIFTVLSVIVSIVLPEYGTHIHDKFSGQWRGLLSFKNQAAWSAAISIILLLGTRSRYKFPYYYLALMAGILMLINTGSATGVAAITFGGIVMALLLNYENLSIFRPLILFVIIVSIALVGIDFTATFAFVLEMLGRDESLTGRTSVWGTLWPLIQDNIWLGVGYRAFWDNSANFFGGDNWMVDIGHAHNAYIEILLDVGIIGLIAQMLYILGTSWNLFSLLKRGDKDTATLLSVILTLTIIGIAGALFFRGNTGIWILITSISFYATGKHKQVRQ